MTRSLYHGGCGAKRGHCTGLSAKGAVREAMALTGKVPVEVWNGQNERLAGLVRGRCGTNGIKPFSLWHSLSMTWIEGCVLWLVFGPEERPSFTAVSGCALQTGRD